MFNLKTLKSKNVLARDVGIDLGTSSVIVYVEGKGIVLNEPSVVAVNTNTDTIEKIGKEAQAMLGRNPEHVEVIRPLKDGVISHYAVTEKMIQHFFRRACGNALLPPRVVVCIPTGASEVEERAVIDAGTHAGAKRTFLVEEPLAAAIGAGIDVRSPVGRMIIDVGGGTTDVAVISLGGIVVSKSCRVAGDEFDSAICAYVRRRYNVRVGERTAENVKKTIGVVYEQKGAAPKTMTVKGRCLLTGMPKEIILSSKEMLEAMMDPISEILDTVCYVIEHTPPDLVGDILKHGIVMTGGGSCLSGFDKLVKDITGIETVVASEPMLCVARGTGKLLSTLDGMTTTKIDLSHRRFQRI